MMDQKHSMKTPRLYGLLLRVPTQALMHRLEKVKLQSRGVGGGQQPMSHSGSLNFFSLKGDEDDVEAKLKML